MMRLREHPISAAMRVGSGARAFLAASAFALLAFMPGPEAAEPARLEQAHGVKFERVLFRHLKPVTHARGFGFGFGGGGGRARGGAPGQSSGDATSMSAHVAEIRAHASDGPYATRTSNAAAPNGLEIKTRPTGSGGAFVEYASIAALNTAIRGNANLSVKLAPGIHTGYIELYLAGTTNIRIDLTGCTINAPDGDTSTLQIIHPAANIEVFSTDRSAALNGCFFISGGGVAPASNIWLTNLLFAGTRTLNDGAGANDNDGATVYAAGMYMQGCRILASGGGVTAAGGSTNLIAYNCEFICPKFADAAGYESCWRMNGVDQWAVLDCRLETLYGAGGSGTLKNVLRSHAGVTEGIGGGVGFTRGGRLVGAGIQCQYPGAGQETEELQSERLAIRGLDTYLGDATSLGLSIPAENTGGVWGANFVDYPMNALVEASDVTWRSTTETPGATLVWATLGGEPAGTRTNCVYAADVAEPAWSFAGSPEDLLP
jgi:hypothetical protein